MTSVVITQPMLFPWPGFFEQLAEVQRAELRLPLEVGALLVGSFGHQIGLVQEAVGIEQLEFAARSRCAQVADVAGACAGEGSGKGCCTCHTGSFWPRPTSAMSDNTPRACRTQPRGTSLISVISEGAPKRFGGPQYPVPRLT